MSKKTASLIFVCAIFILLMPHTLMPHTRAAEKTGFVPSVNYEEGRGGDIVEISIYYDGSLGKIGAFLLDIGYDETVFEFVRAKESKVIGSGYTLTSCNNVSVKSIYTVKGGKPCIENEGKTFSFEFRVNRDAPTKDTAFSVKINQIVSPVPEELGNEVDMKLKFSVLAPLGENAQLISLKPDVGVLVPEFSPDIYQYKMEVPFEVKTLSFSADCEEKATFKVNRKTLGAGGSNTDFIFTVVAEDGETSAEYKITVHRQKKPPTETQETISEYEATQKPKATVKPTATPKPKATPKVKKPSGTIAEGEESEEDTESRYRATGADINLVSGGGESLLTIPEILTITGCAAFLLLLNFALKLLGDKFGKGPK